MCYRCVLIISRLSNLYLNFRLSDRFPAQSPESKDNAKLISPYDSLESKARVRKRANAPATG